MDDLSALMRQLAEIQIYHNSAVRWLSAACMLVGTALLLQIALAVLKRRASALHARVSAAWLAGLIEAGRRTQSWFVLLIGLWCASLVLVLPPPAARVVVSLVAIGLLVQLALWAGTLVTFAVDRYTRRHMQADPTAATTMAALGFLGKVAIWTVALLLGLENLGVDVTAVIAGIGIGGVAVALAAQNILGDLFASASIVLDKPFVLGDFIIVGNEMGTVEHIGLKTTRVRALSGQQIIFPNGDLLKSRIHNYKRMEERRAVFTVGVTYEAPSDKLAAIAQMLREIVEAQPGVRFDRAHFKQFGDFALIYEVAYYVLSPDHKLYMDIQHAINLAIHRRFAEEGIQFAYPTQTILLRQ